MPPGLTAPCSLAGLLAAFRPCFTAPTFQTFVGLVVGLIAQTRRRTVCGMLTGAGLEQVWHHSRAHRLFTNARWSGDALGLALADLIVARLLPPGAALTIAVDDTLFKRSGKKIFGVAWHHDGAAKGPKPIGFGNCWVVAGIVVQLSFLSRPVCLPVLARLWRPRHTGKIAHARELAELIAARYPDRTVHVVGDAAYVGERLRDVDARITWTSRLKVTSVLHELPPPTWPPTPQPRMPGAPPKSVGTAAPIPCRSPNEPACGMDRFAAEPCASFSCATTSRGLGAVTTAVMDFRWSPPIWNPPRRIWWPAMPHGGASSRPSPTPARSSVWARPAIGPVVPSNGRCRSG
jgi:DDE superfamily endonuclease